MRLPILLVSLLLCACISTSDQARAPAPGADVSAASDPAGLVEELVATDRAFSGASAARQGVLGIGEMFHQDVVMFAIPVPGFSIGRSDAIATLSRALGTDQGVSRWTPVRAGLSADGRHGFTLGYLTTRLEDGSEREAKYLSYWVRQPEGWRVALYKLVPRPAGDVSLDMMQPLLPTELAPPSTDAALAAADRASLSRREQEFSDQSLRIGLGPAFAAFGRPDSINLGGDASVLVGAEAIAASLPQSGSPLVWSADQGVRVASSGDLGVTWGYLHFTAAREPGRLTVLPFFTVWYRESRSEPWRYVAE